MCTVAFIGSGLLVKAAGTNDVPPINVDEKTGYIFTIPCQGLEGYISNNDKISLNGRGIMKAFERHSVSVTVIFGIVNVTHFDNPLIVSVPVKIEFPAATSLNYRVDLKESVKVNIRKEYYDMLKNGDFSKIRLTILVAGNGIQVMEKFGFPQGYFSNLTRCKAEIGDTGGLYPDNGGEEVETKEPSLFNKFFDFLTGIFSWNITYAQFCLYVKIGVCVLGGMIALGLLIKFFKFVFGK